MRDAERGCRGASHDGLFAEFGKEFLLNDEGRNQKDDQGVDELGCFQGNVNRVFAGEINFGGFGIPVGAAVADGADGVADSQDVRGKGKCVELLEKLGVFAVVGNAPQFRDMIGEPLQADAQKGAGRSRRKVGDTLSFDEKFADVGRHVFVGFDADGRRENDFGVLPERHAEAALADADVNRSAFGFGLEKVKRETSCVNVKRSENAANADGCPAHVTGDAAVRTSEVRTINFWRNN